MRLSEPAALSCRFSFIIAFREIPVCILSRFYWGFLFVIGKEKGQGRAFLAPGETTETGRYARAPFSPFLRTRAFCRRAVQRCPMAQPEKNETERTRKKLREKSRSFHRPLPLEKLRFDPIAIGGAAHFLILQFQRRFAVGHEVLEITPRRDARNFHGLRRFNGRQR